MTVGPGAQRAHVSMLRETVAGSVALGLIAVLVSGVSGHAAAGIGVALGLLLGSANGYLIVALLDHNSPFLVASLMRLGVLTALALGAAVVLQGAAWTVLIGVGAAQLVMVVAGVRQGMRT